MILLLVMEGYYSLWRICKHAFNPFNNSCYPASVRFNQKYLYDVITAMRGVKRLSHILNDRVDLKAAPASFSAFLSRERHAASSHYVFNKSQFHSPFHPASPRAATSWNASTPFFFFFSFLLRPAVMTSESCQENLSCVFVFGLCRCVSVSACVNIQLTRRPGALKLHFRSKTRVTWHTHTHTHTHTLHAPIVLHMSTFISRTNVCVRSSSLLMLWLMASRD